MIEPFCAEQSLVGFLAFLNEYRAISIIELVYPEVAQKGALRYIDDKAVENIERNKYNTEQITILYIRYKIIEYHNTLTPEVTLIRKSLYSPGQFITNPSDMSQSSKILNILGPNCPEKVTEGLRIHKNLGDLPF